MKIEDLFNSAGNINSTLIKSDIFLESELNALILSNTGFLPEGTKFSEKLYCYVNNISNVITCDKCGKLKKFHTYKKGYNNCSLCFNTDPDRIDKIQKTKLSRYGSSGYNNREKCKETCLQKYGVGSVNQCPEIKQKQKQSLMNHHGVDNASKTKDYLTKRESTWRKKYGDDFHKSFREKSKITCQEKYGNDHYMHSLNPTAYEKLNDRSWLMSYYPKISILEIAKLLGEHISPKTVYDYLLKHNIQISTSWHQSSGERSVITYIKSFYQGNVYENIRSIIHPKELDIYIPKKNLAIEFNGAYHHSKHPKNYHLDKTIACLEKGIQLIHIFDYEWELKQNIWKSMLLTRLETNIDTVYARKCEIRLVEDSKAFLDGNHLQGYVPSAINLGLYFNNELLALMTFGKPRYNKNYAWELIRYCNKLNTRVIGGAGKLLRYFEKQYNPQSLISYADRRYSIGTMYKKLGFTYSHSTQPNYNYIKNGMVYSRLKFQKHKLEKQLEIYDSNLSEKDNMNINGYIPIYDCGNLVYTISYT